MNRFTVSPNTTVQFHIFDINVNEAGILDYAFKEFPVKVYVVLDQLGLEVLLKLAINKWNYIEYHIL